MACSGLLIVGPPGGMEVAFKASSSIAHCLPELLIFISVLPVFDYGDSFGLFCWRPYGHLLVTSWSPLGHPKNPIQLVNCVFDFL